ncbi:MAG TPA: glycoside hydrolase family protein [Paraburkholderia sp.]|jgi:lysozyme|uniref:lysozyme n=1 Tax=Paraburkholderia sp. TaxID=1926495 RepID=UPI002DF2A651|nr:glycoside hydrolase family protein [Paraburkholderia sp.]
MPDALATAATNTDPNSCVFVQTGRLCKPWKLSRDGYTFMAVCESGVLNGKYNGLPVSDGFIVKVYDDGFGLPTVGLGHKVIPSDNLRMGDIITVERARKFFEVNLRETEAAINRDVMVALYQHEYDALVSTLFTSGTYPKKGDLWYPASRSQHLADFLNHGEYDRMRDVIRTFVARRVPWRRRLEARLFESGNYDARH